MSEELFHLREDSRVDHNPAEDLAAHPALKQIRAALGRLATGTLLPR